MDSQGADTLATSLRALKPGGIVIGVAGLLLLGLMAVPVLRQLSHLPVVVDPSHAAGRRDLVGPLSFAAAAAGADGIIVEVHPSPEEAICDGPQALRAAEFAVLGLSGSAPGAVSLFRDPPPPRVAYVLGNETSGISPAVAAQLTGWVGIPMAGGVESLNVASAAAVVCFEWARRRHDVVSCPQAVTSFGENRDNATLDPP